MALIQLSSAQVPQLDWGHAFGSSSEDIGYTLSIDNNNNIIVAGTFRNTVDFDPGTSVWNESSSGLRDIFLAKYDYHGNVVWVNSMGSTGNEYPQDLTIDNSNGIIMTGGFYNSVSFGGVTHTSAGDRDIFVGKYNVNGNAMWNFACGDGSSDQGKSVATDQMNDVYVAGYFSNTVDFDPSGSNAIRTTTGSRDLFLAKYSSNGAYQWVHAFNNGGSSDDEAQVATDQNNNVIFAAEFGGSIDFNPGSGLNVLTSSGNGPGGFEPVLAKYNSNGAHLWAKTLGGYGFGYRLRAVCTDRSDNIIAGGSFLAKFDPLGNLLWGYHLVSGFNWIHSVKTDSAENIFVTGSFGGTEDFDPDTSTHYLSSNGSSDGFLAKYSPMGKLIWARNIGSNDDDECRGMDLGTDGNPVVTGFFHNTVDFDPSNQSLMHTSNGNEDIFFAKYSEVPFNEILGNIFLDLNNDGVKNNQDFGFHWGHLSSFGPLVHFNSISHSGNYRIAVDTGTYTTSFAPYDSIYQSNPVSSHTQFLAVGYHDTVDFAIQMSPGYPDLQIHLVPEDIARPGFDLGYQLHVVNVGTDTMNGNIVLFLDDSLTLLGTTPNFHSYQGDSITWNFTAMAPFEAQPIQIQTQLSSLVSIGNQIRSRAEVKPIVGDSYAHDNISILEQFVSASYDPNDKWVSHEYIDNQQIADSNFLTYRIRFQNTGTDTAFNVFVRDTLDANLNWSSLEMITSSHDWEMSISNMQYIEWRFIDIQLPDSNVNEPTSHGYILYRIRPKSTLQLGDEIHNSCSIYFDFNVPVKTNTVISQVIYGAYLSTNAVTYCEGEQMSIDVFHDGVLAPSNQTHVVLSDPFGSFLNADTIATVSTDSSFFYTIPTNYVQGGGYLLKAITTNPFTDGELRLINLAIDTLPNSQVFYAGQSDLCLGQTEVLNGTAGSGYQYQWLNDSHPLSGANSNLLSVNSSGNYQLVLTNSCGLDTSAAQNITVHPIPASSLSFNGSEPEYCEGDSLLLIGGSIVGAQVQWLLNGSPVIGVTDTQHFATTPGSYQFVVSNHCGVDSSQPIQITELPLPLAQITPTLPIEFCDGDSAIVKATTGNGYQYQWFNTGLLLSGENNPDLVVTTTGNFGVVVNNQCGTDTSDEVTVTVHPLPLVTFDTSYILCHDQSSFTLSGGEPLGGDYSGTGVSSNSFSAKTAGIGTHNISYTYTDNYGCSDTAWTQVDVEVCGSIAGDLSTSVEMTVWPNPADEIIHLEWNGNEDAEVRVWSTSGILVAQQLIIAHSTLRIDSWAAGVYVIEVLSSDQVWREKVVVE